MLTRPFRGQSPFPTWQRLSTGAPATRSTLSALTGFVRSGLQLGHFFASDSARFQRHLSSTARKVKTGQEKPKDLAVTLHGLFGVSVFWTRIHSTLRQNNFEVAHFRYPGSKPLPRLANELLRFAQYQMKEHGCTRVHFLAHSMGGLILRTALSHPDCPEELRRGCAVFIAPAARGSRFGRRVGTKLPALQSLALLLAEDIEPRLASKLALNEETGVYTTHSDNLTALLHSAQDRIAASLTGLIAAVSSGNGDDRTGGAKNSSSAPSSESTDPTAEAESAMAVAAAATEEVLSETVIPSPAPQPEDLTAEEEKALWPLDAEHPQLDPQTMEMSVASCLFRMSPRQLAANRPLPGSLHAVAVILGSLPDKPETDGVIDQRDTRMYVSPGTLLEQVKFVGAHSQILVMQAVMDYIADFLISHQECLKRRVTHSEPLSEQGMLPRARGPRPEMKTDDMESVSVAQEEEEYDEADEIYAFAEEEEEEEAELPQGEEEKGVEEDGTKKQKKRVKRIRRRKSSSFSEGDASMDEPLLRMMMMMQDVEYLESLEDLEQILRESEAQAEQPKASGGNRMFPSVDEEASSAADPRHQVQGSPSSAPSSDEEHRLQDDDDDGSSESGLFSNPPLLFAANWSQTKEEAVTRKLVIKTRANSNAQKASGGGPESEEGKE